MEATTVDVQSLLSRYVDDLNAAVASREFPPFVQKWFASECMLNFHHQCSGIEKAQRLWDHLLPKGNTGGMPREVHQVPYRVDEGRVYCYRWLQGGNAPRPLYGLQETQFDERTLISEIVIRSVQDKPEVEVDPTASTCRLGRIFLQFAEVFNEYFLTGDHSLLPEWCSPDITMSLDSTFWNMGVIMPHNRIAQTARFTLSGWERTPSDRILAQVDFIDWGGLDASSPWDIALTPDGKIRELVISLEM
jgi:hypothetical protein